MAKPEIEQFAKELFLTPRENNPSKHKYSFQQIANEIQQKYNMEYERTSIAKMADKPDDNGLSWRIIWQQGQRIGIDKIIEQKQDDESYEESFFNTISGEKSNRQKKIENHFDGTAEFVSMIIKQELEDIKKCLEMKTRYDPPDSILRFMQTNYVKLNQTIMETEHEMLARRNVLKDLFEAIFNNPDLLRDPETIRAYEIKRKELEGEVDNG